jgi:hypothetical protein
MKYMIQYTTRQKGLNFEDNLESSTALTAVFSQWAPEEGMNILAFVHALAGNSGFALCQTDDAKTIGSFVAKFSAWNDVVVTPVLDVQESIAIIADANEWTESALQSAFLIETGEQ